MTSQFAVVHEAEADLQVATGLADRVLVDVIDWLEPDMLASQREWVFQTTDGCRLTWTEIKTLAIESGIRVHGHFDGEPGLPDAAAARRAVNFLLKVVPELKAIVLVRDQDDQPDRREGLEQARRGDRSGVEIVVGFAIVERESWVVSGFDPLDDLEKSRIAAEQQKLGFDPRMQSHELTAGKDNQALRSPKRVLRHLCGDDPVRDRERQCWEDTSLDVLRERGTGNGLPQFLDEVRDRLGPLIGHIPKV
jgi:hypothetical protein